VSGKKLKSRYFRSISFLFKGALGYVAYVSIWPSSLSPFLNRLRGVKIKDISRVYIAPNVLIDTIYPEHVTIEEEVYITRGVKILAHFNPTVPMKELIGKDSIVKDTIIKRGAFLGVNAVINPGVTVGQMALVAAGAVVVKDVPDYAIVGGNPATVLGDVRDHEW
jgi:acetyltransferase-like isoleucine patch superfamily enzyme